MIVREGRSLKLTKITIGRFWNVNDVLDNLDMLCPKLINLVLPNVTLDQCLKLKNLSKLSDLVHVHIGQVKFDRLIPALTEFGSQLKTLTFSNFLTVVTSLLLPTTDINLRPRLGLAVYLRCFNLGAAVCGRILEGLDRKILRFFCGDGVCVNRFWLVLVIARPAFCKYRPRLPSDPYLAASFCIAICL